MGKRFQDVRAFVHNKARRGQDYDGLAYKEYAQHEGHGRWLGFLGLLWSWAFWRMVLWGLVIYMVFFSDNGGNGH